MAVVSSQESPIMDELAHIPAGYSYVRFFDYRLNPEHPPLMKALSGLPLLFFDLSFPTDHESWTQDVNGQWSAGNLFIFHSNNNNAELIISWSRLFPIILTLLLIFLVFWWSRELMGSWWALAPTFLTAVSPHILSHGHYVTTDIGAALGFIAGLYFFVRFLKNPSWKNTGLAGLFWGLAQLTKFSIILLIPIFVLTLIAAWWMKTREKGSRVFGSASLKLFWVYIRGFVAILVVGIVVVWMTYALFTIHYPPERQLSDTSFILGSFAGGDQGLGLVQCTPQHLSLRCLAEIDIWMSDKPTLQGLGQYILGVLMVMQRSSGGNTAYFLGEVGASGWWYYFPVVFLLKESIPALLALIIGISLAFWRFLARKKESLLSRFYSYLSLNLAEFSMMVLVIVYWIYSIRSPLNIGFRHILPTIPFLYILSVGSIKRWKPSLRNTATKKILMGTILLWVGIESIIAYPFFLSYFNEIGGGVKNGYQYVTDSNYDWGQDLARLQTFVKENRIDKIAVDYFGGGDVLYYLGENGVLWSSSKGDPRDEGIRWLAVSINTLQGAKAEPSPGFERKQEDEYLWLEDYKNPYARAGTSIFIYHLED